MKTSSRLFGNISTIYIAIAQSTIFWLLRIYHLDTAHHPNIYLLQIGQLFHHWKSSKYLITLYWKIIWQTSNSLFGNISTIYIGSAHHTINFPLHNSQLFAHCKSTNYFTTRNLLNLWLLCIEKLYDNFKSTICKLCNDLYCYCAKPNFLATAHLSFCYCASLNYLSSANRPIISPLRMD